MKSGNRTTIKKRNETGATLIDCVVALVVSMIGVMAIFSLIVVSIKTQTASKDLSRVNSFARAKIEELKNSSRVPGGNLNTNTTGYFDSPVPQYTRRWQIISDTFGSQTVRVRVVSNAPDNLIIESTLVTRMN